MLDCALKLKNLFEFQQFDDAAFDSSFGGQNNKDHHISSSVMEKMMLYPQVTCTFKVDLYINFLDTKKKNERFLQLD